jgi:hypothetical protein
MGFNWFRKLRCWPRRNRGKKEESNDTDMEAATDQQARTNLGSAEEELATDHQTSGLENGEGEQAEGALRRALEEIENLKYENMERQQTEITLRFRLLALERKTVIDEMQAAFAGLITELEIQCEERDSDCKRIQGDIYGCLKLLLEKQELEYDVLQNRILKLEGKQCKCTCN